MKVAVLGAGQWGTALAQVLCDAGNDVLIWGRNSAVVTEINSIHKNSKSLGVHQLPDQLRATTSIVDAVNHAEALVLAIPAQSLRANLLEWKGLISKEIPIISSLKGIELETHQRMSEVIHQALGTPLDQIAIVTGPNLAKEVVMRQPAGAVAASRSQTLAEKTAKLFGNSYFRVYTSNDVIGCELAAAAKNVIALAVGISIGMGYGENTQALVITRGLNELTRLGMARGAEPMTFVGLAGVGDLLATCGSPLSRNRSFGEILGKSGSMERASAEVKSTVEGVATASAITELARSHSIEVPIMTAVAAVVRNTITPEQAMIGLMKINTGAEINHQ
jgi:glycerol-3-phosphate dehydrogenase (NAD(P)+)